MSKRTVSILVSIALALTAFSFFLSRRDSEDWRSSQARRLFPFPWRDVAELGIARQDGKRIDLQRLPGEEWEILLDGGAVDSLNPQAADELAALVMLPWRQPLADAVVPDHDASTRLTVTSADGDRMILRFGSLHGNLLAVSSDDDPGVAFGVLPDLAKVLDWPESRFRNLFLAGEAGRRPSRIILRPAGAADGGGLDLVRAGGGWRLEHPVEWPAEPSRAEHLLDWLEHLQAEEIIADHIGDPDAFGFGPESAAIEIHFENAGSRPARRIEFGDARIGDPESRYARVVGRDVLFSVPQSVVAEIALDQPAGGLRGIADSYRLRTIDVLGPPPPRRLTLERLHPVPERLVIERSGERDDAKWTGTLERGGASLTFAVEPPTADEPLRPMTRLLSGLSGLRIRTFLADDGPGPETAKWTAHPAWRFEALGADGASLPPLTLYAIDAEGGLPPGRPYVDGLPAQASMRPAGENPVLSGIAASIGGRDGVVELFRDLAYMLCLPPYRYQSRRLLDQDVADWRRVELRRPGGEAVYRRDEHAFRDQWWRQGAHDEPLFDDNNRFAALLLAASQLRTTAFVADVDSDPAEFGLDQPEITMIVYGSPDDPEEENPTGEAKRLLKLTVGNIAEGTGAARYARLDDSGAVFLLPGDMAEALKQDYR